MGDVDFRASRSTGFTTRLFTGASIFALTWLAATPALAQDAPAQQPAESPPSTGQPNQQEEATNGNTIVVTGIRASLRSARNIKKNATRIPSQEVHEIHFAIGQGMREGKPCKVTCRVIGRPDPLYEEYADAGTSMNMSIGVQHMLCKPMKPVVWAAEEYFEVGDFFRDLRKRHFEIQIETQMLELAGT